MAIFGDDTEYTANPLSVSHAIHGRRYVTGEEITLESISAYVKYLGAAYNAKCAIYNGNTFVAGTVEVEVDNVGYAWVVFAFSSPPTIGPGTYGLVIWSTGITIGAETSGAIPRLYDAETYNGWPATADFGEPANCEMSIYATIKAAGWTGKISGVTNPAKIMGIAVADIAKVNGVA